MTQQEELRLKRIDELKRHHREWLQHPVTRQTIELLQFHLLNAASSTGETAFNDKATDSIVRAHAAQIRALKTISVMLTDADVFVNNVMKYNKE